MKLFEEFKLYERLWEDVSVDTEVESPTENNATNNVATNAKPIPKQIEALIAEYNENVTRSIRWNYAAFDRIATKLPQIVNVTAEYDKEAGCYDVVLHFSRKVYKPEVAKIFNVFFIARRFEKYKPDVFGRGGGAFKELLDTCAVNHNTISFWHGRLQNMGIRTGLRDKKTRSQTNIAEWVDASGRQVKLNSIQSNTANGQNIKSSTAHSTNKLYIIFNYYAPDDLDDFWMFAATPDRVEAVKTLTECAEDRIERLGQVKNTLVCYLIDPNSYDDMTADDFIDAANAKYNGGQDFHYDHREVVYALSAMTKYDTPLYELSMGNVDSLFYNDFLYQNKLASGITYDDLYDSGFDSDLVEQVYNDPAFQKFIKNKLTNDINKAL